VFPIIAKWTILDGKREEALAALSELADEVQAGEPFAWMYTIHTPDLTQHSLPTPPAQEVIFFSVFQDEDAFKKHLEGPIFQAWAAKHMNLFLTNFEHLFVLAEYLERQAGFVREQMLTPSQTPTGEDSG
jgi:quinol monooxygenase YgiN